METWSDSGDIRAAWLGAFQIARRVVAPRTTAQFPAFHQVMAGDDAPAKTVVMRALLKSVELTPEGLTGRDASVGMEFADGVATAILRMRQFQADVAAPRPPRLSPSAQAALPIPDDADQKET